MQTSKWIFKSTSQNDHESNPIYDEFFSASVSLNEVSSLVRESIQNSLDEPVDVHLPLRMRFFLGEIKDPEIYAPYVDGLADHAAAALGDSHLVEPSELCRYLVIEDFNTTGLRGDVEVTGAEASLNPQQNGYWFFAWSAGQSPKPEGKRGKWGVGKVVFPRVSKLKAIFAYSVRVENADLSRILFGTSLLRYHNLNNDRFGPHGWWGTRSNTGREVPLGEEAADGFCQTWNVSRKKNETGLSVVIPFLQEGITSRAITESIVRDYFMSLFSGALECVVEDSFGNHFEINRDTLPTILNSLEESFQELSGKQIATLGKSALDLDGGFLQIFEVVSEGDSNKWNESSISDSDLAAARLILDSGAAVAFRVLTMVPKTSNRKSRMQDSFTVLLAPFEGKTFPIYYRQGILISEANRIRTNDVTAMVLVEDGILADLLGAAEGPAHVNWSDEGDKFKDVYTPISEAKSVLTWVKFAPQNIASLLQKVDDDVDEAILANFFPTSGVGDRKSKPSKPKIPTTEKPFRIVPRESGFKVVGSSSERKVGHSQLIIQVAYKLRKGNSFKHWDISDFALADKFEKDSSHGFEEIEIRDNYAEIRVDRSNFELCFGPFDWRRALDIKVEEISTVESEVN